MRQEIYVCIHRNTCAYFPIKHIHRLFVTLSCNGWLVFGETGTRLLLSTELPGNELAIGRHHKINRMRDFPRKMSSRSRDFPPSNQFSPKEISTLSSLAGSRHIMKRLQIACTQQQWQSYLGY